MKRLLLILTLLLTGFAAWGQKPGATPVKVSHEKQMMNGRKYYVHIVESGQTVYSITKAYRVGSFDAVTHVDVHSLHPGDTVWLPFRGQFTEEEELSATAPAPAPVPVEKVYVRDTIYVNVPYAVHDTTYVNVPYAVHDTTYVDVPYAVHDTTYVDVPYAVHDTTYVNVPYAVHDTAYVNVPYAVHDTTYVNVPYAVHDTTVVVDTVRLTEYVTVRDTAYINVPYAVHDSTVVVDTVRLTEYVTVRDTAFINVPYAVHDTTYVHVPVHDSIVVVDTVKLTEYVTLRDTIYTNVPYAVHDSIVVVDTVKLTEYVTVRDTAFINVPYAVHDSTVVADTVKLTEYVTVHDTAYITVRDTVTLTEYMKVHDTTYIDVPVHDTTVITDTETLTKYMPVHDTTYITVRDTVTLTEYVKVHDTTYIDVPVHDTTVITDTETLTKYVPVHDTTYITVRDTVTLTEYVRVHDTTYKDVRDTVMLTEYVRVHDTTYINVHDTTYIDVLYTVHDTTIVTDTVTLTEYVTLRDTTYVNVHDTAYIDVPSTIVTDTVTLTEYVRVHDTAYIDVRDTIVVVDTVTLKEYVSVHDTTYIDVPYAVHDSIVVVDTVEYASSPASDLAFASTSAMPLAEYALGLSPSQDSPTESQRQKGKTLKVGLMMPLHLDQMDQISTSKFDVEQRGKKSYRQFEFIEFYEGLLLALDKLSEQGISVELNVADVSGNTPAQVEQAFVSHQMGKCDFVVALLLRDCFDKAAELAQQAGVYIVNPMATRSELCADNPHMVKIQPSLSGMVALMLANMKFERPDGHLYIIHSNSAAEKAAMDELKRQLTERGDIKYTIFNWSQSARLVSVLKATPKCNVLSIYDQGKDNNRVYSINLLNRLASIKKDSPTLYTLTDWTREYNDIDFAQLQLLGYHTYSLAWDMTNDVHVQFLQSFRNRFGSEPTSQLAATAYDLMLYIGSGLARRNSDFWLTPGNSLPTLVQPLHLGRSGAGLENDKAQLYRLDDLRFIKALFK